MENIENTQIEAISEGLLEQDHQEKRHEVLIRDIQQKSLKQIPSKLPHRNSNKRPRTKKEKREMHKQALRNHVESSIQTMKGSYKV
jgi:hypothetical protein